ncbi:MAG TPA: hypothetical protein P5555_07260 [Candidatus Paceibacterota bacterium]|nr:hypothetical protein [Verrucomicrobiota bacterium]HRZ44974.1 hypothetical protein [Candidatus Paceibacterota bacterium]HRZ94375.1 hypothetical protein [Candidatus Paceibacterota bacterium]
MAPLFFACYFSTCNASTILRPAPTIMNTRIRDYPGAFRSLSEALMVLLCGAIFLLLPSPAAGAQKSRFAFSCTAENDVFRALKAGGLEPDRYPNPEAAVSAARPGSLVLLMADEYPGKPLSIPSSLLERSRAKNLRLYIEFPQNLPGLSLGPARETVWERFIVNSDRLGPGLPKGRLLTAHDCRVLPVVVKDPLVVIGRVAGYNHAIYGIPTNAQPVLFEFEARRMLVATTKLSSFLSGRFAPAQEWVALWSFILNRLGADESVRPVWEPHVTTMHGPTGKLPAKAEQRAFDFAVRWRYDSGLLISEDHFQTIHQLMKEGAQWPKDSPLPAPNGDGRFGILEGFFSNIRPDGKQTPIVVVRADCQAESAMVLAMDWALNRSRRSRTTSSNLLDFLYYSSDLCGEARGNSRHPAYGLIGWGSTAPAWKTANYGDDNARAMLATMLAAACLRSDRWDEPLLRALFANLRTTGQLGFRGDRIDMPALEQHGWKHFHDAKTVNDSPHFEAYSWACFLWAYRQTGEREFLVKTKTGMRMMMEAFPQKWRWNDNMERAHMLLCLAWLARIEDTPEHRQWLQLVINDYLAAQHASGALPERFRAGAGTGHYKVPASNEAYGTTETPLLQENGDPVSDQLYVSGFALLGLHEAAAVLKDPRVEAAADRLAEYLCRIQARSNDMPWVQGNWFRAFDFLRWEPWASSGDSGWGAWSIESGWAQAWTAAVLGLRLERTTLWDRTARSAIKDRLPSVKQQMLQNDGSPWREPSDPTRQSPDQP